MIALAPSTRKQDSSLLVATKCLCVPHTPVREEGWSFLDDDGCSAGQDEGRECTIDTTRVRAATDLSSGPITNRRGESEPHRAVTERKVTHQGDSSD